MNAFATLGLDVQRLRALNPTEQLLAIVDATRQQTRATRQYLLETAGITGTLTDSILHSAVLSSSAYETFANNARQGSAFTEEQAMATRELAGSLAAFRHELLLGSAEMIREYLPAIQQIVLGMADAAGSALKFIAENRGLVELLFAVTTAALAAAAAYKAMAIAIGIARAAQAALNAGSILAFTNPAIAAIAGFGLALLGVVWLIRKLRGETEQLKPPPLEGWEQFHQPTDTPNTAPQAPQAPLAAAAPPTAAAVPPLAGATSRTAAPITNNITITVHAAFASARELGRDVGSTVADEIQAKLDTSVLRRQ